MKINLDTNDINLINTSLVSLAKRQEVIASDMVRCLMLVEKINAQTREVTSKKEKDAPSDAKAVKK